MKKPRRFMAPDFLISTLYSERGLLTGEASVAFPAFSPCDAGGRPGRSSSTGEAQLDDFFHWSRAADGFAIDLRGPL